MSKSLWWPAEGTIVDEPDATSVVMTGPDGRQVEIDRGEISELAHAMTSDEPWVRAAAIEKRHTPRQRIISEI